MTKIADIADESFLLRLDRARTVAIPCVAENVCADCSERDERVCPNSLCAHAEFFAELLAGAIMGKWTLAN